MPSESDDCVAFGIGFNCSDKLRTELSTSSMVVPTDASYPKVAPIPALTPTAPIDAVTPALIPSWILAEKL